MTHTAPPDTHTPAAPAFHSLDGAGLERFLLRTRAGAALPGDVDLGAQLTQILERARALVPARSGFVLLDDPLRKVSDRAQNDLWFVTAFGPEGDLLPGTRLSAGRGIAGKVYATGRPHLAADAPTDPSFNPEVDRVTGQATHSVVAAPIAIGSTVCGVIELVDSLRGDRFDERDLALLEIFAGYTSSTLQNALDAKRAAELARRDDLTGLSNDRWLHHRLVEMIAEANAAGEPLALIFFDLDRFKNVNDTHGHLAGSQVLREIGFLLRRLVTDPAALLARYGGDEFVVCLPAASPRQGQLAAEEIRSAVEQTVFIDQDYGDAIPALHLAGAVTASLGLAEYAPTGDGDSPHASARALLQRADTAMYAAKAAGRNRVIVAGIES
ncbi:MAG TPA: sensor domain-containing diguanylate cyclase [Longimicrobium sp.]|nr:sensor domain-containing diguanylate cyclase [Longimicrobium sp.]